MGQSLKRRKEDFGANGDQSVQIEKGMVRQLVQHDKYTDIGGDNELCEGDGSQEYGGDELGDDLGSDDSNDGDDSEGDEPEENDDGRGVETKDCDDEGGSQLSGYESDDHCDVDNISDEDFTEDKGGVETDKDEFILPDDPTTEITLKMGNLH
ncbi:hypothetical protein DH2020_007480 [Rehmannia glutinosa]|uniref:Uncharacterized protein n=1 Tax=Rehmannia glutinosa TaxID=99300 RepID=A0ABR0TZ39_REHGL